MNEADSASDITFIVPGQAVPLGGATRGGAAAASPAAVAGFGGRGTLTQRVQVGARRGTGEAVRLTARPGRDAVVLHITNGPSLMLHPETARELLLAQSGLTRDAQQGAARRGAGSPGAAAMPDEIEVPAQLGWKGLEEQAASVRGATRGRLGDVLLSAIDVVTGLLREPAAKFSAEKIGAMVDGQVEPGVYALRADAFEAPLKGTAQPLARIKPAGPAGAPLLVMLHGTFSETQGTFGKLWKHHPQKVRDLFARYEQRVYALDHPTLAASPIDNALMLARAMPDGARVHLLTHSRGGLVAEVLARVCAGTELDAESLEPFKDAKYKAQRDTLRQLAANLKGRDIRIERVVRVACPARGTLLASKRMDAYVSVLKWSLELASIPVAPGLIDFIGQMASQRTDPAVLPGLEAMMPDSALVQWLHTIEDPLPGQLRVVAGDLEGDSIGSWIKTLLADAYYWTDNDLVVQTSSMYGGAPRAASAGKAGASCVFDRGGKVTHFSYFSNERTAAAVCSALMQEAPAEFRPIGPLSWAGTAADGVRAARAAAPGKPPAERPAVLLLPGILGSNLSVDGKRIWLSIRTVGGLGKLAWHGSAGKVAPDGPIGSVYDGLIDYLSATHEVIEFAFDWRCPLELEARRLADAIEAAMSARAATGQPVRLVAHSMGGLVARTVQLEWPELWQRWLARPGSRLLMLGTPNGGSWAPMQMLSGDDLFGNTVLAFGLPFQDHKARQLVAEFPGLIQLQAGLLDDAQRLHQTARWQELADLDMATVRRANWWHDDGVQRNVYRWGVPPQAVLDQAVALRRRLDGQGETVFRGSQGSVVMVLGHADFTPAGFEVDAREGLIYLDAADEGDGRVTRDSALLPGVAAWQLRCGHSDLPCETGAYEAYLELLENGRTQRLKRVVAAGAASRGAAGLATSKTLVRSRPSRVRRSPGRPPEVLNEVFNPGLLLAEDAVPARRAALHVSVLNANLKFISRTLLLGHYAALSLTGTERVVDRFIGGAMSASLEAGLYPEATGSHQIFVNTRQDPDNPLALPRPPQVVVAGLGEEGKLRSVELTRTVRQATLAWAQRLAETPGNGAAHFEIAATLIGSGGTGISVGTSAQAIAQGVREANEKLQAGGWPQVSHLQLVELYLDRATEAWRALQMLGESAPARYALASSVSFGSGALRRPVDTGYRGAAYDFISARTERGDDDEPRIVYTVDTKRARSEVRAQATQSRLVGELVRRASNDANRDTEIGRTLFQLLVPVEMEASLGGSSEMLLELDDGTAAIPWELLDPLGNGRNASGALPWAIRSKLLRKLRTVEFRSQVTDARTEDDVLVIGEPQCDPALYPPLPGARAEAEAVRDALSGRLGLEASRVHAYISSNDLPGPDAAAVTAALLARRYRIVHIAGHGEPELPREGKAPLMRGVVLSDKTFLGPHEVQAMRVVPELVFLNCCHLAADPDKLLRPYDRSSFAAGVAKQLIRIGVRCVIAAGWAVEDAPANAFATAFYQALLGQQRFMDAVHAGRKAARDANPQGNTWAAYQCYGDPDWIWRREGGGPRDVLAPVADEFTGIASPSVLALALETLAVRSNTQGARPEQQVEKIRYLEARFEAQWGGMGAVAEAFGLACAAAKDTERAAAWYRRAIAANDGSASVKAGEQLANLNARLAWERVAQAAGAKPRQALDRALAQGRIDIESAIAVLSALVSIAPTMERESLLGSACKRLAMMEEVAGRGSAQAAAIERMAGHYQRAETLARQVQHPELFYPALNRMAAELIAHAKDKAWSGFDAEDIALVRQSLERKAAEAPDFWSVVGLPELSLYEALAERRLAAHLPAILAAYADLHQRAGGAWMWASVLDQASFVLKHFEGGAPAEVKAAAQLLGVLKGYAKR
jgi:CHAT domain-containing protein